MQRLHLVVVLLALSTLAVPAEAGLYYSGEAIAELPSQWRGFLLDQRTLRNVANKPGANASPSPLRVQYEDAADKLEKARRERGLSADELTDLGALYVRLGSSAKAVELLRVAQRHHPDHFRIVANLGTAWQLQGDLEQAATCLQEVVRLAPGKFRKAEELQLKLLRLRQRQTASGQDLDDLFGVRFEREKGSYEPGRLAVKEREKLPADAIGLVQQLALWLPADGPLLWQLAELANAHGDVKTAAAILDGCVTEFGMRAPELRQHRQVLRAAADELAKGVDTGQGSAKAAHGEHAGLMQARSVRPLLTKLDRSRLPSISATGLNLLPWEVLAETNLNRQFKPTFAKYLQELNGKQISLSGYIQPLSEDLELGSFMLIEYPVGCWYCEMPEITGIIYVELPTNRTTPYTRSLVKITGKLTLNATDPENFLYTISSARVSEAD